MTQTDNPREAISSECEDHINRCFCLILHYDEVQQIVKTIKKVMLEREDALQEMERD